MTTANPVHLKIAILQAMYFQLSDLINTVEHRLTYNNNSAIPGFSSQTLRKTLRDMNAQSDALTLAIQTLINIHGEPPFVVLEDTHANAVKRPHDPDYDKFDVN